MLCVYITCANVCIVQFESTSQCQHNFANKTVVSMLPLPAAPPSWQAHLQLNVQLFSQVDIDWSVYLQVWTCSATANSTCATAAAALQPVRVPFLYCRRCTGVCCLGLHSVHSFAACSCATLCTACLQRGYAEYCSSGSACNVNALCLHGQLCSVVACIFCPLCE